MPGGRLGYDNRSAISRCGDSATGCSATGDLVGEGTKDGPGGGGIGPC